MNAAPPTAIRKRSKILRVLLFLFYLGFLFGLTGTIALALLIFDLTRVQASLETVRNYHPPITTRVHAGDGSLIHEFANERRIYVTLDRIPKSVQQAFIAAEDQRFYDHVGIDFRAIARAMVTNIKNFASEKRPLGASTITQQVARNFLLNNEVSYERKLREAIIAFRIEDILTKEQILELYLNRIYLGVGRYGVAAAALYYFNKSLDELELAEVAFLAALPKAPNNYHPLRHQEAALNRRNWVLQRMYDSGFITADQQASAAARSLDVSITERDANITPSYFVESVRLELNKQFGTKAVYEEGYSVRTSLDPELQQAAHHALQQGLLLYDKRHGWRGPLANLAANSGAVNSTNQNDPTTWQPQLQEFAQQLPPTGINWQLGMIVALTNEVAEIALTDGSIVPVYLADHQWMRPAQSSSLTPPPSFAAVLAVNDIVYVSCDLPATASKSEIAATQAATTVCQIQQLPEVDGGLVALDPHSGRVLAMAGGWSFLRSEFNRVTQALRQPGSAFKPFVYLAALEKGYPPTTRILDAPLIIDSSSRGARWRPKNYSGEFYGPQTMRVGIEKSRNLMTVRLAMEIGIGSIVEIANRFNINNNLTYNFASALGSGETTLLRLTTAYAMLINGGKLITPTLIDQVQDRYGNTVYRTDRRSCSNCKLDWVAGQLPPYLPDVRRQVASPQSTYQIASMLRGVINRGTGWRLRGINFSLAGKTGTTDNSIDTWFIGFTPDLAIGVFVGHDTPRTLADPVYTNETGSSVAVPIWKSFIEQIIPSQRQAPFRVPPGVYFYNVDSTTGQLASNFDTNTILEVFKSTDSLPDQNNSILITGKSDNYSTTPVTLDSELVPESEPRQPEKPIFEDDLIPIEEGLY